MCQGKCLFEHRYDRVGDRSNCEGVAKYGLDFCLLRTSSAHANIYDSVLIMPTSVFGEVLSTRNIWKGQNLDDSMSSRMFMKVELNKLTHKYLLMSIDFKRIARSNK